MQIAGYDIETLGPLLQPRDKWKIDEHGLSCTTTILAIYATWQQAVPGLYSPHRLYTALFLRNVSIEQEQEIGELCLITLTYDQRYADTPTTPLPKSQFGVNGIRIIEDITLHSNFNAAPGEGFPADANSPWSQFWDASKKDWQSDATGKYLPAVPSYLIGWTKFPDAGATVWTKIYFESQPTDPLPQGRIVDPGFGFGPSGCYLVNTCDQQKENAFWYRLTHYDYFPNGVPTQIFQRG